MSAARVQDLEIAERPKRKATFWWRFRRNKLAVFGLTVVVIMLFLAVFADFVAPTPYDEGNLRESGRQAALPVLG